MAKDHASPEERLLALIRGKHKRPEPDSEKKEVSESEAPKEPETKHAERKPRNIKPSEIFKAGFLKTRLLEPASLKIINRYLAVLTVGFIAYLFIDIIFIKPEKEIVAPVAKEPDSGKGAVPEAKRQAPDIKDYSYYSTEIAQRNIFGQAEQESQHVITAEDLAGNMGLVGIIAGDNPQAVIEDKKSQKTYYMTKGESFNGFTVEEITQGRVILDYQGKKIALSL